MILFNCFNYNNLFTNNSDLLSSVFWFFNSNLEIFCFLFSWDYYSLNGVSFMNFFIHWNNFRNCNWEFNSFNLFKDSSINKSLLNLFSFSSSESFNTCDFIDGDFTNIRLLLGFNLFSNSCDCYIVINWILVSYNCNLFTFASFNLDFIFISKFLLLFFNLNNCNFLCLQFRSGLFEFFDNTVDLNCLEFFFWESNNRSLNWLYDCFLLCLFNIDDFNLVSFFVVNNCNLMLIIFINLIWNYKWISSSKFTVIFLNNLSWFNFDLRDLSFNFFHNSFNFLVNFFQFLDIISCNFLSTFSSFNNCFCWCLMSDNWFIN